MTARRIHLIFKTHLDIGFTDHAENVRRLYHERFIPQAIATGEHFHAEDPQNPKFIWTTGAWLIWDHLNTRSAEEVARLERAIEKGVIRWHGLPFTTHSELMSPALFRAGLSYAAELDRRFGRQTIAAKMTDVPGHTGGIVPLMAGAGLKFLHIGVNTACPPPDVPEIFRWRAPGGEEIVVMYQQSYGATHLPEGLSEGLSFAHTNDNIGPQQIHQVVEVLREMGHRHPDAEIRAGTLEGYGAFLWEHRERFPVVDMELGDSWIHGAASDPVKIARFRALQRLHDIFEAEGLSPARHDFGRKLTLVAEHTCGVDVKTFLRDETAWDRPAFEAIRKDDYRFRYTEASWGEQRAYLGQAVEALSADDRRRAEAAIRETEVPAAIDGQPLAPTGKVVLGDMELELDPGTGDILALAAGNRRLEGDERLVGYRYESYDADDLALFMDSYLTDRPEWAILDHGKPGLHQAQTALSASFRPQLIGVARDGSQLVIGCRFSGAAQEYLGAPAQVDYIVRPTGDGVELAVVLRGKPANRMPEAGFLEVAPKGVRGWEFCKTGLWQEAARTVRRGGGALQAIFAARATLADGGHIRIEPLDSPLAGPLGQPFMLFPDRPPAYESGLAFNLHNNKWGTNFPMWWEGDFMSRFRIQIDG
ncbi:MULTISPECIES: DUF5054 domain-containing protein [unclassified Sinorhizobium]|uniref:DUF5054 domain-containing protein n=1 Tax=unclassified Sinorhizobium TaxID=2613772 RepID=UPI0024C3F46B|nr:MULTISPECIES: DUF5054 domain-containing protein [unclassified Sinorhizobium]MDK1377369.1 DUF5054 domain-containing protein [Sinorhizobium sp. 6-70]MDK1478859.1 DUF5054 domain-containing protein [Sinorhizobium sp. 6-117]